jgi:hypothetical protein
MLREDFKTDITGGRGEAEPTFAYWLQDAVANYLDDSGSGYISIHDFADFCKLFEIVLPWKSKGDDVE